MYGGCLYRVTPKGKFTVLHDFVGNSREEGFGPGGGLRLSDDGSLIGASAGGPAGAGTVFRATTHGDITYLRMFGENPLGLLGPNGAPIRASDGRLYGSLNGGGGLHGGAIYSMLEDGSDFRVLHYFSAEPGELYGVSAPLLQGSDGMLYGTLVFGPFDGSGAGGVFRLSLDGDYRVLHTMNAVGDGVAPQSGVIQGADGSFYGTNTSCGGDGNWCDRGTVFRLSRGKNDFTKFKVLYTGNELGTGPHSLAAGLLPMPDGTFWSVSTFGGNANGGAVYRISPKGAMEVMASFIGPNGSFPHWGLTAGADGWLYGVTQQGGDLGGGVVFRVRAN